MASANPAGGFAPLPKPRPRNRCAAKAGARPAITSHAISLRQHPWPPPAPSWPSASGPPPSLRGSDPRRGASPPLPKPPPQGIVAPAKPALDRRSRHTRSLSDSILAPLLRLLGLLLPGRHPAFADRLLGARHGEGAGRHVPGDDRARAHVRPLAHRDGRDQTRVGADESACGHDRLVLGDPIVVAGDGPGAEVDARAEGGIAHIG